jgi:membrane protein
VEEFMGERESPVRRASPGGWSIAAALGLLAAALLMERLVPSRTEEPEQKPEARQDASAAGHATEGDDRGRQASSPSEIPARGWKDILLRLYTHIGDHRILALAAGMTYYSILAIFPALAALVSI